MCCALNFDTSFIWNFKCGNCFSGTGAQLIQSSWEVRRGALTGAGHSKLNTAFFNQRGHYFLPLKGQTNFLIRTKYFLWQN